MWPASRPSVASNHINGKKRRYPITGWAIRALMVKPEKLRPIGADQQRSWRCVPHATNTRGGYNWAKRFPWIVEATRKACWVRKNLVRADQDIKRAQQDSCYSRGSGLCRIPEPAFTQKKLAVDEFAVTRGCGFSLTILSVIAEDGGGNIQTRNVWLQWNRAKSVALSDFQAAPVETTETGVSAQLSKAG